MWASLFSMANGLALICWLALILAPRSTLLNTAIFYLGMGLLCAAYAVLLVLVLTGAADPLTPDGAGAASFTTIAGVRAIFLSDGGLVIGWIHFLALDLFAGIWIARDADAKGFSRLVQAPVLALTFIAGPAGVALWLAIRERRARQGIRRGLKR